MRHMASIAYSGEWVNSNYKITGFYSGKPDHSHVQHVVITNYLTVFCITDLCFKSLVIRLAS